MANIMTSGLQEISFEDVRAFCAEQFRENTRLDYKAKFSSDGGGKKIAKLISAFANTEGGTILYGVAEDPDPDREGYPVADPEGGNLGRDPRTTVVNACSQVFPPVVCEVSDFLPNPNDPSKGFLLVRVSVSADVHTVEGGRGIYIRILDHAEPVRPTPEEMAQLLRRREAAISVQESRRREAMRRLRTASSEASNKGTVWVSVGPRIHVEPLLDAPLLAERVLSFSVGGEGYGRKRPIREDSKIRSAVDSVYSVQYDDLAGAQYDVFGNLTTFECILQPLLMEGAMLDSKDREGLYKDAEGRHLGVSVVRLVRGILVAMGAARRMYESTGFVGVLALGVKACAVQTIPLFAMRSSFPKVVEVLGCCPVDEHVAVRWEMTTEELGGPPEQVVNDIVQRVLWAWGCKQVKKASKSVEEAVKSLEG